MISFQLDQRFEKKFKKTRGCWVWTGALAKNGYGQIGAGGKRGRVLYAHRVAYELYIGKVPDDSLVCHTCDNRQCVNPDHLFLGSYKDNMQDAVKKGRTARGERNGMRAQPHRRATGDRNGSRTHPEKRPRGDDHYFRKNPELRRGSNNFNSKLTEESVREILARFKKGECSKDLAETFGVSPATISGIVNRKTWTHVEV